MKFRFKKQFIAFNLRGDTWCVLDRTNGELVARANGATEQFPEQWARTRAKQLNNGESP